jgi:hypothetical protein
LSLCNTKRSRGESPDAYIIGSAKADDLSIRKEILTSIESLKENPEDLNSLAEMMKKSDGLGSDYLKQIILKYVSLGSMLNNRNDVYTHLKPKIRDAEKFEELLTEPCSKCEGSGIVRVNCRICRGSGRCVNCQGRGGKTLGGSFDSRARFHRCTDCGATGRCKSCMGRGWHGVKCDLCRGEGLLINKDKVKGLYRFLGQTVKNELLEAFILPSVVIIKGNLSTGTGFLCKIDNQKFVASNAHVFLGNNFVNLITTEGEIVEYSDTFFCKNRDLMLYKVKNENDFEYLKTRNKKAFNAIGSPLVVYGNSEGEGVVTYLNGVLQSIGPHEIETDALFVSGNSGSPVILDGEVIGVATRASKLSDVNWTNQGTRFTEVRRFAVRVDNVDLSHFTNVDVSLYDELLNAYHILYDHVEKGKNNLSNRQFDAFTPEYLENLTASLENLKGKLGSSEINPQWSEFFGSVIDEAEVIAIIGNRINEIRENEKILATEAAQNKDGVSKVINGLLTAQRQGDVGYQFWDSDADVVKLFTPVSWDIVNVEVYQTTANAKIIIESSNKMGIPVRVLWLFSLRYTNSGWKMLKITEN